MTVIQGIRWESKKLLINSRGLFILLIFLVLKITLLSTGVDTARYQITMKAERLAQSYYERWGVHLTPEKAAEIEAEYRLFQDAEERYAQAMDDFSSGYITREEMKCLTDGLEPYIEGKDTFQEFYMQYLSVREDPENRHLIDTRGWDAFLDGRKRPDILMSFCVLILSALIFSIESGNGMYPLLTVTQYGKRRILYHKLITGVLYAVLTVTLFQLADLAYIGLQFPLAHAGSPVQSLSGYRNSPYSMSLWFTAFSEYLVRAAGAIYLAVIVLCFTEIFRRAYIGIFSGTCAVILPYFLFYDDRGYLLLPLPTGLLEAGGYFTGPVYKEMLNGSQEVILRGITPVEFLCLLLGSAGLMAFFGFWLYKHYVRSE